MLRKFNPLIENKPKIFSEDVYLFTDSGKVLTGRQKNGNIKNIFSLVDSRDLGFVRENMFFSGLKPLLLVESSKGPIFIDNSLFGSYRLLVGIIPHFSREETLAIVQNQLSSITFPSPTLKNELKIKREMLFDEFSNKFAERLLLTHRGAYYYRVHGRTNADIAIMLSEMAYDFSDFYGCEIDLSVSGVNLYEMKNAFCVDSYAFALTSLLPLARNYSIAVKAKMDVFFNEMGIYFEFGFELDDEYKGKSLFDVAEELKNFRFRASSRLFECDYYQNERAFAVRGYPWFRHPNSADIKEKRKEFIYN